METDPKDALRTTAPAARTERRRALLQRAISRAPTALLLVETSVGEPRIVFCNDAFEDLTGYPSCEAIGRSLQLLEGPDTQEEAARRLRDALRGQIKAPVVLRHRRRDGSTFWDEVAVAELEPMDGSMLHQVCTLTDVTARILTERALRETLDLVSRAKKDWEWTVDSLPELVFVVDARMRVIRANRSVERWGVGDVQTLAGQDFHEVLHPQCAREDCHLADLWMRLWCDDRRLEEVDRSFADRFLGRRVHVTMRSRRRSNAASRCDSAVIVVRDVTAVYEREETRRRRLRFEAMEYLVAGLAHEVGNPIAAMRTTLDVWARSFETLDEATHQRYLARVNEGLCRLQTTVERILGSSNDETRRDQVVSVDSILARTVRLFEDQAQEKGVALLVGRSESGFAVTGDAAAIDEVLTNLTKNAIEACEEGDRIMIDMEVVGDRILVRICDDGQGIARSDMDDLFVPFFTTKPTGTGLGLAHADRLMAEMGGEVEIDSKQGEGTVVTLRFRRADAASIGDGS